MKIYVLIGEYGAFNEEILYVGTDEMKYKAIDISYCDLAKLEIWENGMKIEKFYKHEDGWKTDFTEL